jgi:glycosyltransferase involved in cell wall biosynthesis
MNSHPADSSRPAPHEPRDDAPSRATDSRPLRIAIVYDCLYPHSIGGGERWYRSLATRLAARHHVTYLTRRQWEPAEGPDSPSGVKVIGLDSGRAFFTANGRRSTGPPLRFGVGVLRHLLANPRAYDVVHTCSFPYFPLLFASAARAMGGPPVVTDWVEVWPRKYWRTYAGPIHGGLGAAVQALCIRVTGNAFTFSELTAAALRNHGYSGVPTVLRGLYDGPVNPPAPETRRRPLIVYVGRHIAGKHVASIPAAIALARTRIPQLEAIIYGNGPERPRVLAEIDRLGLQDRVTCPGFVPWDQINTAIGEALCLLLPSEREGYGLVVVEAAARGTPSILVDSPNNAATALVTCGINGYVADSAKPLALATAILNLHRAGPDLADSTWNWFRQHQAELRIDRSVAQIEQTYRAVSGRS